MGVFLLRSKNVFPFVPCGRGRLGVRRYKQCDETQAPGTGACSRLSRVVGLK